MSNRIYWSPPTLVTPVRYRIDVAASATADYSLAAYVAHDLQGANWEAATSRFFWDHQAGDDASVYRVRGLDSIDGTLSDTGPYQPDMNRTAQLQARTKVDHNYGTADALRFVTASGTGIPDAVVRIYLASDYEAGNTELALHIVETKADGRWKRAVYLEPGNDYVVVMDKRGSYTASPVTITV